MPTDSNSAVPPSSPGSAPRQVSLPVRDSGEQPWYAEGLKFSCTQCGNCCSGGPGYVWLNEADFTNIAAFLQITEDEFSRTYVRRIGNQFSLTEKRDYDCVFLKREKGIAFCGIYTARPNQCRTWPFWKQNLKSPDAWKRATAHCPGMQDAEAPVFDLEHIEKGRLHPDSP